MTDFGPPISAIRDAAARSLAEDLGLLGDLTSLACVDPGAIGTASFVARRDGVLAGTAVATEVFALLDQEVAVEWRVADGDEVAAGDRFGTAAGPLRSLLTGERCALNFLCHLSGIATLTRRFVRAAHGKARVRDTRKTTPGLRSLEKAAVRAGGGFNHRESLSDAVLIKDNHLVGQSLRRAVERARARWPGRVVEVECDTLEHVAEAKETDVDLVLLDNMTPAEVRSAVELLGGAVRTEVSGGVTLETVHDYANAGADFISVGAITHSAPVLDLALDIEA